MISSSQLTVSQSQTQEQQQKQQEQKQRLQLSNSEKHDCIQERKDDWVINDNDNMNENNIVFKYQVLFDYL